VAVWTREDSPEAMQVEPEQNALIVPDGLEGRPIG
jgi:hypothetical protein